MVSSGILVQVALYSITKSLQSWIRRANRFIPCTKGSETVSSPSVYKTETYATDPRPIYARLSRQHTPMAPTASQTASTVPQPEPAQSQVAVVVDASLQSRAEEEKNKSMKKKRGRQQKKFFMWLKEFGRKARFERHHKGERSKRMVKYLEFYHAGILP